MMHSLILRASTRLLVSLILMFSVYLLIRGHNAPGGGFSAALVSGTAFFLYAVAEGADSVRQALRFDTRNLIVIGMLLALASGLTGLAAGQPFLTGLWWTLTLGHDYEIVLGTPLFFDIGVYLTVLGSILTLILALEES